MLILNVSHHFCVKRIVRRMRTSEQYINLDTLHMIDIIFKNNAGMVILLACIQFLRFIAFNRSLVICWSVLHKVHSVIY